MITDIRILYDMLNEHLSKGSIVLKSYGNDGHIDIIGKRGQIITLMALTEASVIIHCSYNCTQDDGAGWCDHIEGFELADPNSIMDMVRSIKKLNRRPKPCPHCDGTGNI